MKQTSYPCSCITCGKATSNLGIVTHYMRSHGTKAEKAVFVGSVVAKQQLKSHNIDSYNLDPKLCKRCTQPLTYVNRQNDYCSHSCAAKVTNITRDPSFTIMPKNKSLVCTSCKTVELVDPRRSAQKFQCQSCKYDPIKYPVTPVHPVSCKFCSTVFYSHKPVSVCKNCQHLKWANNKNQYSFKFNVFDYPDLFDLELLKQVGWVCFGGKRGGTLNQNGLSRDHKVSVSDAKKYRYDPYYISHPINCELMPHVTNNTKKSKSSLTYADLVDLVKKYEKKHLG